MTLKNKFKNSVIKNYDRPYQFAFFLGSIYVVSGIVLLWESEIVNTLYATGTITFGIAYLILGYFVKKEYVKALWLLLLFVLLRSILLDLFYNMLVSERPVSWSGIVLTGLWTAHILKSIKQQYSESE